jgi:hypothetical protein
MNFAEVPGVATGGEQIVTLSAQSPLRDHVDIFDAPVTWKLETAKCGDEKVLNHKVYVTYGKPHGGVVTEKRIEDVCNVGAEVAEGDSNLNHYGDKIYSHLNIHYNSGVSEGPDPIWLLHRGSPADQTMCAGKAKFFGEHVNMLGLPPGQKVYCHPDKDGTYTVTESALFGLQDAQSLLRAPCVDHNISIPVNTGSEIIHVSIQAFQERLISIYSYITTDANGMKHIENQKNNFEAAYRWPWPGQAKYYALNFGIYASPKELVNGVFPTHSIPLPLPPNEEDLGGIHWFAPFGAVVITGTPKAINDAKATGDVQTIIFNDKTYNVQITNWVKCPHDWQEKP